VPPRAHRGAERVGGDRASAARPLSPVHHRKGEVDWQKASSYNKRSRVEPAIGRLQAGDRRWLRSGMDARATAVDVAVHPLSRMLLVWTLGNRGPKPETLIVPRPGRCRSAGHIWEAARSLSGSDNYKFGWDCCAPLIDPCNNVPYESPPGLRCVGQSASGIWTETASFGLLIAAPVSAVTLCPSRHHALFQFRGKNRYGQDIADRCHAGGCCRR
jgi:hypothetical protein